MSGTPRPQEVHVAGTPEPSPDHRYPFVPGSTPFRVARTHDRHLITTEGRRILDAGGGAIVANIGYGRREVAEAAAAAMREITYVVPTWPTEARVELMAEVLDEWMPPSITRGAFTSGGSESVDTAIRLARQHHLSAGRPERWRIIGRHPSYHGVTLATLSAGRHDARRAGFEPLLADFGHVPWDDTEALDAAIRAAGPASVAAFIAEPVVGSSGGCLIASAGYWRRVREICDTHGVLLVADEVMTGFGRTGRPMAMEHYGIEPDIVVSGKGLGGGYAPIGGVYASEAVMAPIAEHGDSMMFFTYGAHDMACATALTVLRILRRERLVERAAEMGRRLLALLEDALGRHPHVSAIRGIGLMLAVELVADRASGARFPAALGIGRRVVTEGLRRDVWFYPAGSGEPVQDAVMLGPAFTVEDSELATMVSVLEEAIDAAAAKWEHSLR